jgi:hypothetical protein
MLVAWMLVPQKLIQLNALTMSGAGKSFATISEAMHRHPD